MALIKGTNSNVTVAEADAELANRLDASAWTSATLVRKAQSLITATGMLDELSWSGAVLDDSQGTAFPREGDFFDVAKGIIVSMNPTPVRVEKATIELALHLLTNENVLDDIGRIRKLDTSSLGVTDIILPSRIPKRVRDIVRPLLQRAGRNTWWRAN